MVVNDETEYMIDVLEEIKEKHELTQIEKTQINLAIIILTLLLGADTEEELHEPIKTDRKKKG